ncbi:TPA: orotidine-5'-phosphate decarboxylase [Candidatus Taylorbacteria bacterium]|nr:orotidine-5'-phosphate decarboxylase [Candidatus Taylorbacteria bacterium]
MVLNLPVQQRLIVAADFKPVTGADPVLNPKKWRSWVRDKVLRLSDQLARTGVIIKVNSALRSVGYDLIDEIHARGLRVFADLKLIDIDGTLSTDGTLLTEAKPELVTAMCLAGPKALLALKAALPKTEILGVTVLTSLTEADALSMFHCSINEAAVMLAKIARDVGLGGLISSVKEAPALRAVITEDMTVNTPNIRPNWIVVKDDDQNKGRSATPAEAFQAGVSRIVMGRPIVEATNPYDAVMRTLKEIEKALVAAT